jgi:hypothetical protein
MESAEGWVKVSPFIAHHQNQSLKNAATGYNAV